MMEIFSFIVTIFTYYLIAKWSFNFIIYIKSYLFSNKNILKANKNNDEWVFITGITEGIGKHFGIEFAKLGYNIVGVSRRKEVLDNISKELENNFNIKTNMIVCDFSNEETTNYNSYEKLFGNEFKNRNIKCNSF